jgi:hypothetical protein
MNVSKHILLGFLFSILLYFIFPSISLLESFLIFLSSFLIDADHYLYYVYKKRDLSLRNAYRYFIKNKKKMLSLSRKERNKIYGGFVIFHGIEFLILLFLLSLISEYFLYILIGCAFHLFSDILSQKIYWNRTDKLSLIYDFIKFRKLKNIDKVR